MPSSPKPQQAYRIQLSMSQSLLLVILGGGCLVLSFYLGFVTGQSLRDPSSFRPTAEEKTTVPVAENLTPKELTFFDLGESQKSIDLPKLEEIKEKTQQLTTTTAGTTTLADAEESVEIPENSSAVPTTTASGEQDSPEKDIAITTPVVSNQAEDAVVPNKAEVPLVPTLQTDAYTVQVFSSHSRERSEQIVNQLKREGYTNVHIQTYTSPDNELLFRVRVGHMEKPEAESLAFKLRKLSFIESVQVMRK